MDENLIKSFLFDNTSTFEVTLVLKNRDKTIYEGKIAKNSSVDIDLTTYGLPNDTIISISVKALNFFTPANVNITYHKAGLGKDKMVIIASSQHQTSKISLKVINRDDLKGYSSVYVTNNSATVVNFKIKSKNKEIDHSGSKSVGFGHTFRLTSLDPDKILDGDTFYVCGDVKAGKDPSEKAGTYNKYSNRTLSLEIRGTTFKTWFNIMS